MKTARRPSGKRWLYSGVALLLPVIYGWWTAVRPLPLLKPDAATTPLAVQTQAGNLVWPAGGQSAVGIVGSPVLETHGVQKPTPIASTAKLITALAVLHAKPLALGQPGPTITLSANDAALYAAYVAQDGSVVPVTAGEQISEYQMLETMLLPSANNMADSLADWAFGSLPAYTAFTNKYVQQLGLGQTHIGSDASGFAPSTTSTAGDLVRIGELAMQNPVLAQIVGQTSAAGIPDAGTIKNLNSLLGVSGIIGIKTGNTTQAGGVFVSASRLTVNKQLVTVVTALAGTPTLAQALSQSLPLMQSAQANFQPVTLINTGSIVGRYALPWGGSVAAVASRNLDTEAWNGSTVPATIKLTSVPSSARAGQTVGSITTGTSLLASPEAVSVTLQTSPSAPSLWWRLLHPL